MKKRWRVSRRLRSICRESWANVSCVSEVLSSAFRIKDGLSDQTCKSANGKAEQKPADAVGKADLPQKVIRQATVIPNGKPQAEVEQASRKQLNARDKEGTDRSAEQHGQTRIALIETVDKNKAYGTAHCHAGVCPAALQNFKRAIKNTARKDQKKAFHGALHRIVSVGNGFHDGFPFFFHSKVF